MTKRYLLRVDFNVPLEEGSVSDATRIKAVIPTIEMLLKKGNVLLLSHLGRPEGKVDTTLSLRPVGKKLEELLGKEVTFCKTIEEAKKCTHPLALLENLRFHVAEEKPDCDPNFAKKLSQLGDFYVDDAFGCMHRDHTSITRLAKLFPGKKEMGLLVQKELSLLKKLLTPAHPFLAIIGGAKISTKMGVLLMLLEKADQLFIGGAMANTFLVAKGVDVKDSLFEERYVAEAKKILETHPDKVHLPIDSVKEGEKIVDIGPQTIASWEKAFSRGKTFFWNGPLGLVEKPPYDKGTKEIAKNLGKIEALKIAGGGDSIAIINKLGLNKNFTHLSTGGGALLEWIAHEGHLPGIEALES